VKNISKRDTTAAAVWKASSDKGGGSGATATPRHNHNSSDTSVWEDVEDDVDDDQVTEESESNDLPGPNHVKPRADPIFQMDDLSRVSIIPQLKRFN
jgi:hypothetical protein